MIGNNFTKTLFQRAKNNKRCKIFFTEHNQRNLYQHIRFLQKKLTLLKPKIEGACLALVVKSWKVPLAEIWEKYY
jgi:hypothetical protein